MTLSFSAPTSAFVPVELHSNVPAVRIRMDQRKLSPETTRLHQDIIQDIREVMVLNCNSEIISCKLLAMALQRQPMS